MKRILTLDGGGLRGLFSLQILKRIEKEFREESGKPAMVLREAFDFFAGTSTGAIIAAYLAWGKSVQEIEDLYNEQAEQMFFPAPWYQFYKNKYSAERITRFFQEQFWDDQTRAPALLDTEKLWFKDAKKDNAQKYLLIVMRNATTGASWPVSNNPEAIHNETLLDPAAVLKIPLWQLLRASTAAPTFFPPETIKLNKRTHIFMDGGITPYNNPSLIALFMATMPPFGINWPAGREKIHLVSVGTGHSRVCLEKQDAERVNMLDQAKYVVPALIHTVAKEQDKMCRVLGHCLYSGKGLDDGAGDLDQSTRLLTPSEKKFTYVRYNHEFTTEEIAEADRINTEKSNLQNQRRDSASQNSPNQAVTLDNLNLKDFFQRTGRAYAAKAVKRKHLFPPKA